MRTFENLSEHAKRVVAAARKGNVRVAELISYYEAWRSDEHPVAPPVEMAGVPIELLITIREKLGLTRETSDHLEVLGDAINVLGTSVDAADQRRWHDAKLAALDSGDRDKKKLAIRHLQAPDYDDELVVAALIESLARDDEELALLFSITAAMELDPMRRGDVVQVLHDELQSYERRRSYRAAFFASMIEQMHQNHPEATPAPWLVESLVTTVTESDDPASYAATVDLCAVAVYRSRDVALIEEWLRADSGRRRMFAAAVLRSIDLSSFDSADRRRICTALTQALKDLALKVVKLAPGDEQWLETTLRAELAKCA